MLGVWVDRDTSFPDGVEERQGLLPSVLSYADAIAGVEQAYQHVAIRDRVAGWFGCVVRDRHRMMDVLLVKSLYGNRDFTDVPGFRQCYEQKKEMRGKVKRDE